MTSATHHRTYVALDTTNGIGPALELRSLPEDQVQNSIHTTTQANNSLFLRRLAQSAEDVGNSILIYSTGPGRLGFRYVSISRVSAQWNLSS